MNKYEELVGREVKYRSGSGKEYVAIVTHIPEKPEHGYIDLPSVSLMFKDVRGKYIKKSRVIPKDKEGFFTTQVWWPFPEGKQLWQKREDGKTYFVIDGL